MEKYQLIRHWALLTEQTLAVTKQHIVIAVICQHPTQHEGHASSLTLRTFAFGNKANMLPNMEQNWGHQVLKEDREQTIDPCIVPVYQKALMLAKVEFLLQSQFLLLSVPQTDVSHTTAVCWHLASFMLHRLRTLKALSLQTRFQQNQEEVCLLVLHACSNPIWMSAMYTANGVHCTISSYCKIFLHSGI